MNNQLKETFLVFDTSNNSQGLMKSIGLIMINKGEITDKFYSAINLNLSDEENIANLKNLWFQIERYFIEADFFVCFKVANHKASLLQSFALASIDLPEKPFVCINTLAVLRLPETKTDRESLTRHFDLFFEGNDNKDLNESYLSYYLLLKLLPLENPSTLKELVQYYKDTKDVNAKSYFMKSLPDANFEGVIFLNDGLDATLFDGKSFLLTGEFSKFKSRDELASKLIELGGKQLSGITKKLDFLIVGTGAGPSKIEKVKDLQANGSNLKLISEIGLYQLLNI